ncbi:MAG TPA: hypothetical protein PK812_04745 [Beijerinckiaceae bacterium]|nr:hypothetical protein [Beijerinckiaceae bacterium]
MHTHTDGPRKHVHDHGHGHAHGHSAVGTGEAQRHAHAVVDELPPASILTSSLSVRLSLAGAVVIILWCVTWWALG